MSRILLADDSAHAQRIGECILREEGFEVVSVTDGDTALVRLADVDPDVILASVLLPRKNGYEICRYVKEDARQRHTRVVLTAGAMDPLDEAEALRVQADASLRKPFEATILMQIVRPLVEAAQREREQAEVAASYSARAHACSVEAHLDAEMPAGMPTLPAESPRHVEEESLTVAAVEASPAEPDPELVRAAVTLALDTAFPALVEEITSRVLASLKAQPNPTPSD
jgi:CheY-like chemotaxis protein